jgi:tetratricopeptide (TPR) repeat protein
MTPERWQRLKEIFEAALEVNKRDRGAFLREACHGDGELFREAEQLLEAHEDATKFLPTDPAAMGEPLLSPGTLLASRFRIDRYLGRGGMGVVYAAWDLEVQEYVAIKTLRSDIARDATAIARLRNEVQRARRISHRNVCRVFDLVRDAQREGDAFLLSMELIEGETLADRIARDGPIPANEALQIARQLAAALEAAHLEGIIHRDFKTGNVMLEAEAEGGCRAVITDFGLARMDAAIKTMETLTQSGIVVGTPGYLAPEQMQGQSSRASDIYAFGVVLCEMVTGQRPTASGQLPPARVFPPQWQRVVKRCVAVLPGDRFATPTAAVRPLSASALDWFPAWRRVAGVLGALALPVAGVVWIWVARQNGGFAPGSETLLCDITNLTGDQDLSGVTAVFRNQLQQSSRLTLWDRKRLSEVARNMGRAIPARVDAALGREIAYREGVPLVVTGSLSPVADQYTLNVVLEALETGSANVGRRWQNSFPAASKTQLFGAVHDASVWIRKTSGETSVEIGSHNRPPEDVTTSSWQALACYTAADELQGERKSDEAVQNLKQAVLFDPHFALALMRMGDILVSMRKEAEGFGYYREALAEADRGRLTRHEELRLRGLYAGDTWDWAGYEAYFAQMEKEFPYDWMASFYLGDAYRKRGMIPQAIGAMKRARSKTKPNLAIEDNLGGLYVMTADEYSVRSQESALRKLKASDLAHLLEGELQMADHQYLRAESEFHLATESPVPTTASEAEWFEAAAIAERGEKDAAREMLSIGARKDDLSGLKDAEASKLAGIAELELEANRQSEAVDQLSRAANFTDSPQSLLTEAMLAARCKAFNLSRELLERLIAVAPDSKLARIAKLQVNGETLLAVDRTEQASAALSEWSRIDTPLKSRIALAEALEHNGDKEQACKTLRDENARPLVAEGSDAFLPGHFKQVALLAAGCADWVRTN